MTMAVWIPDHACEKLEADMEEKNLPESTRDDIRRFCEYLRFKRERLNGDEKAMPEAMKSWLIGAE